MNRNWFTRMLMLYVPVFLVVPAFLFFAFSFSLSETNRKDAERSNEFVTEQAMMTIDSALSSLDQKVTLEMLRNRDVIRYFTTNNAAAQDMTLQVDVMNLLQELKMANPVIHSIYMVRYANEQVLNVSTTYPLGKFGDKSFVQSLQDAPNSNWSGVRSYKELQSDDGTPVVTLTRSVSIFAKDRGIIVVNVGADSLHAMLSQMNLSDSRVLELFDRDGKNIFGHLATGGESGTGHELASGELRTEQRSNYTGWTIASSHRYAQALNFMLGLSNIWFALGLLLCGVSIAWIVYVTLRNYRPIRALVARLQGLSDSDDAGGQSHKNEFTYINTRLERMIDQSERFRRQFEEDMKVKQNYFVFGLLEGTRKVTMAEWEIESSRHGLPTTFGIQQVLVIEVDRRQEWSERYGLEEQRERQSVLEELVRERANQSGMETRLLWVSMYQLAVILIRSAEVRAAEDRAAVAELCQESFREHLPITLSIGVGDEVEQPEHLQDSYEEALRALRSKPAHGVGLVIPYSEERVSNERIYSYFRQVDQLIDAYRLLEPRWKEHIHELFRRLQEDGVSREGIDNVLHYLDFYLDKAVSAMNDDYYRIWSEETMPALDLARKEMESLGAMAALYIQALERFWAEVESRRSSRSQVGLMKEVKAYIEVHYAKAEMSLDYLQDVFGIGGKYISRLFKEEYGLKFVDYLIELRMQEAKRLLSETDQPVQDIAERVGYSSPISFARTFKKTTGYPPADYRKRA